MQNALSEGRSGDQTGLSFPADSTLLHKPEDRAVAAVPGYVVSLQHWNVDACTATAVEKQGVGALEMVSKQFCEIVEIDRVFADRELDRAAIANTDAAAPGPVG